MNSLEYIDISCPYCGEIIQLTVDCSVSSQEYVEDCAVCCQPMLVNLEVDEDGRPTIFASMENE